MISGTTSRTTFAAMIVAALAAGSAEAQPRKGGTLVYANVAGLGTQDPHAAAAVVELE